MHNFPHTVVPIGKPEGVISVTWSGRALDTGLQFGFLYFLLELLQVRVIWNIAITRLVFYQVLRAYASVHKQHRRVGLCAAGFTGLCNKAGDLILVCTKQQK